MTKATPVSQDIQKDLDELRTRIEDITVVLAGIHAEPSDDGIYDSCLGHIKFRAKKISERRQARARIQQISDELKTLSEDYPDIIRSMRKS
jgi:hypothetical protein